MHTKSTNYNERISVRSPLAMGQEIFLHDKAQIPLKVAICGGGVGGMFLCYALQKRGFDVKLFEKSAQFSRFGGPIQLASNALSCLKAIDPRLFDLVMERFTFTGTRKVIVVDSLLRPQSQNFFISVG